MANLYDALIVGCGPSGLMAARVINTYTKNFLIIDPKSEIGRPLKCGEGIRKDHYLGLFQDEKAPYIKNKTKFIEVIVNKTSRRLPVDYFILDRPEFEKFLSRPLKDNIQLQTSLIDIKKHKDCLEIITNKGSLNAKIVILAYGCNYSVQKKFKLLKTPPLLVPCYGGILSNHNKNPDTLFFYFDDNLATGLWVFPKNKSLANVGVGVIPFLRKESIKSLFTKTLNNYSFKLRGSPSYAGVFPSTGPIPRTYSDRLLVCGNAAGLVFSGSGEGIYYALKSGDLAGKTAIRALEKNSFSKRTLSQYESSWKKSFGQALETSKVFSYLLFLGISHKKLERLISIPTDEELTSMLVQGVTPLRAKIASKIARPALFLKGK